MADNVRVTVKHKVVQSTHTFTGRLIGFATQEDMRAIANTKDAARRLFSAETLSLEDLFKMSSTKKRIVVATTCFSKSKSRVVYISPIIESVSFVEESKTFVCPNGTEIYLEGV